MSKGVAMTGSSEKTVISPVFWNGTECRQRRGAAVGWSTWRMFARMAVALFGTLTWGAEKAHTVPYVPSAASEGHAGVVRIESRSAVPGEVRVVAVDDAGQRVEAGRLTLHARTAVEFEMAAMESGDASLGLAGTGRGEGDWRLELSTDLDIEARAYARSEGFATALHDATLLSGEVELPLFHPGGDARRSVLRLANARGEPAAVSVRGVDDAGRTAGPVTVDLGPWEARGYAAEELESGSAAGLSGSLGDGAGKWRLMLEAERGSAYALNLLLDGSGTVSSVPGGMSRGPGVVHRVPLFPSAADGSGRRGMVRVVNRSTAAAEVSIEAFDATDRVYEELRLALEAESSAEFDSMDLEQGNAEKGLEGSTGSGEGDWWLELASESDIEVLSYVDGATGPLSAVRGTAGVETETGMRYEVVLLSGEASELRLLNAGGETVEVRVSGTDDAGSPGGEVELTLAPWTAGTLTTTALAEGSGVRGALGAGTGSWRMSLEADGEIDVLSLVRGAGGKLSDVSRRGRPAGAPPRTEVIDATAGGRPDLWVAASASEAELSPGEAFELTATVGNRGGDASATTLRYHRSADATIAAGDAEVGADAVAELAAGATSAESLTLNAPTAAGTYYYGACADAVADETNTANNCSAAVAVKVTEPPRQPDLVVTAASASEAELSPGEAFELTATVGNRGGDASATTLRYYRSTDAAITTSDTQVGTDAVAELAAGATSAESLTLNAPTAAGTYYYGACADAVAEETNTANNCSAAVAVKVTEPPRQPDLVVTAASASEAELSPGEAFELTATVGNRGGDASATTLRYYRSADATITTSDTEEGTDAVDELAASDSSAESIALTAPSTSGTYYYGACVDAVPDEYDTTNNCSSSVEIRIAVPVTHPNLAVVSPSVSDARPDPGVTFTFSATVRNLGDSASASSTLRYYRSSDATVSSADTQVDTDPVTSLGTADGSDESATLMAPSTSGTYYYGACVDAVEGESDMSDNCSAAVEVTVPERSGRPDLAVAARELDGPLLPGEEIRLSVSVRNIGTADAVRSKLQFRVSDDDVITLEDERAGSPYFTPVMAPDYGLNYQMPQYVRAPLRAGTYYYGACVDAVPDESDTTNNCSGVTVTVRERSGQPDLTVTAWTDEYAVCMHALVRNIGTERSVQTVLTWHYGSDSTTPPSRVPSLSPGETFQRGAGNGRAPGNYFACVHAVEGETITNNNCSEEVTIR